VTKELLVLLVLLVLQANLELDTLVLLVLLVPLVLQAHSLESVVLVLLVLLVQEPLVLLVLPVPTVALELVLKLLKNKPAGTMECHLLNKLLLVLMVSLEPEVEFNVALVVILDPGLSPTLTQLLRMLKAVRW
jgi:hypothetical protein